MTTDELLEQATERHRKGELGEARSLYQQILSTSPEHPVTLFRMGLLELHDKHPQEAVKLIERAIAAKPGDGKFYFGLGEALAAQGKWTDAGTAYRKSLEIDPNNADANFSLGIALQSSADLHGAIKAFESAIRLRPDFSAAMNNLGNCHRVAGNLRQAEAIYRQALKVHPGDVDAMCNLGTLCDETGRTEAGLSWLQAAVKLAPAATAPVINLGGLLCRLGKFKESADILRSLVAREPNNPDAAFNLGLALQGLGELRQAAELFRRVTALRPKDAAAWNSLGNVLKELGQFKSAIAAYNLAHDADPKSVAILNNAAVLMRTLGRLEEAERICRDALTINPNHPSLHNTLGNVLKDSGQLDEAIQCFDKSLALDPSNVVTHSNLIYSLSFRAIEPGPILEECRRFDARHVVPLKKETVFSPSLRYAEDREIAPEIPQPVSIPDRSTSRRLRIGYVSPDFRDHCQALFTIPLLGNHDHEAFEIFCYSSVERPDGVTQRISGLADVWRDVRTLDDAALAERIRQDRIDVLVDLTMHMSHNRPLVFARKPAPIQVAWLAYPGTTGISTMDYRLTDPRLDPPGFESHYTERTIRLPDTFWCYDPLNEGLECNALPAESRGYLTLGCLNNPCKITDPTIRLWAGVMRSLPTARLTLMAPAGVHRKQLLARLAAYKIATERVSFFAFRPRDQYLTSYHDIDLGLDTFPYNGHTTSLDSLWMGVPVVTRVGPTCVGRAGLSQLFNLDLRELAAETNEEFTKIAVDFASDLPRLAKLRAELRGRMQQSALMDGKRFARNIEAAYRKMFENHG